MVMSLKPCSCLAILLVTLSGFATSPALSQSQSSIDLPEASTATSSPFARWQQMNAEIEEEEADLEGMVLSTQSSSAVEPKQEKESALDQVIERMQSLPVRMDYGSVGVIYERTY